MERILLIMGGLFNKSKKSISNDQNNKVFNQNQMILDFYSKKKIIIYLLILEIYKIKNFFHFFKKDYHLV